MKKLGLIGYPLSHSFSATYFAKKFVEEGITDYNYSSYPLKQLELLPELLANNQDMLGLNVTIPYKEKVIPYLFHLDEKARKIGAVNVIKKVDNKLYGFNTDYDGFKNSLLHFITDISSIRSALILGTGGSSKAVSTVLQDLNIHFDFASRKSEPLNIQYKDFQDTPELIKKYQLIINCTPLGTFPKVTEKPALPYQALTKSHYLFDLVYNPAVTAFMQAGIENGAKAINGYDMLVGQAEASWKIWQTDKHF